MLAREIAPIDFKEHGDDSTGFLRIKHVELLICAVIIAGCVMLHLPRFYYPFGLFIQAGLSLLSFATPISGMLYLSAAQVIPDPPTSPLPSAQMALLGFLFWQVVRGTAWSILSAGRPLILAAAPFFLWSTTWSLLRGDHGLLGLVLSFAILTGCAAATLLEDSEGRLGACLLAFLAGQAVAMSLFWMFKLKLAVPVEAFNTDIYGSSFAEGARIGTSRGNANALGPPMALAFVGFLALLATRRTKMLSTRSSAVAVLVPLLAVAPPMIASGSRGALISVVCGILFMLLAGLVPKATLRSVPLIAVGVLLLLGVGWQRLGLGQSWEGMGERQHVQEQEAAGTVGGKLIAGRNLEWTAAVRAIVKSPLTGGGEVEMLSYSGQEDLWQSHSTYLDAGLVGGLVAVAFFLWFVLKPLTELWTVRYKAGLPLLLSVYATSIVSIGTTSAMAMKYSWILWGMAAVHFAPRHRWARPHGRRSRYTHPNLNRPPADPNANEVVTESNPRCQNHMKPRGPAKPLVPRSRDRKSENNDI
jgi:hypothetical protein